MSDTGKVSMSYGAESSGAAASRPAENNLPNSSPVFIPRDDMAVEFPDEGYIVPKRQPLPMPYIPPSIFRDPRPLSKVIWCPSLVDRIDNEYSTASANFLYSLPRKRPALRDHVGCLIKRCVANNTDNESYQCFHWKDCPDDGECAFIGPDAPEVMKIIADGGIPLISIQHSLRSGLTFEVVRATVKSKFFAVSHVWSGGLGNPKANQLPTCQIMRLYNVGIELSSGSLKKGRFASTH